MHKTRKRVFTFSSGYLVLALLAAWVLYASLQEAHEPLRVTYSAFLGELDAGHIKQLTLREDEIIAELKPGQVAPGAVAPASAPAPAKTQVAANAKIVTGRLPGIDETRLLDSMRQQNVEFSGTVDKPEWWSGLLFGWLLPFALLFGLWSFAARHSMKSTGPLSVGKAKAKIYDRNERERVTFEDVAGIDDAKAELSEIVGYLKQPAKYRAIGARAPKGVLLVGPPGTGKTLLARAVAGEADVPFFSMSGSEFVQMFVGVGASRVRDLFEQANARAPCIVFIDELDAIGRSRSGATGGFGVHEEREQTLNQLLVEMDGFDGAGAGVVILAATNRPEVLDHALLRAGRFDRQVMVDRPDVRGREGILRVHARKVKLALGADLRLVAQRTPGMVGADLANVVNEAALAATRRDGEEVELQDFEEAIDRLQLGLKRQGRIMTADERRRVAYHESGHTLVALSVKHADPVHRVTIIPRSIGALGATLQLPTEERYLITRDELRDRICVMLAGRTAEEIACGDISTGAQNDLERATETARQMVCRFGMSDKLGLQTYGSSREQHYLAGASVMFGESSRSLSDATGRLIDVEVRDIIDVEHTRARRVIEERRDLLESIAERLLLQETLERVELERLVQMPNIRVPNQDT